MASSKDAALYGSQRQRKLTGGKEISSSNSLSFTSQLSSLISSSASQPKSRATTTSSSSQRLKPKKDDIFHASSARNSAKRAKRESSKNDNSASTAQKHSASGESLDADIWKRSKRKMEEKARLYAAMKRGDVEDLEEKYDVDFDRKWAEKSQEGEASSSSSDDDGDSDADESARETIEYLDEFGRTRKGTRAEAERAQRVKQGQQERVEQSDRFTARPSAPSQVIYGDTIQHAAFDPEAGVAAQMAELARKRDKELTPPPEEHFDASREVREKGTGFFRFSNDEGERKRQMDGLDADRRETERKRMEREGKIEERKRVWEERRREIMMKRGKRKADDFLDALGEELSQKPDASAAGEGTEGEK